MRKLKLLFAACALFFSFLGGSVNAQSWVGNEPEEGTFLLYNVGADKFINNGDPTENWGTNAYLQSGFGLDIQFELNNGAYNLNTNVSNGGNSHYLATSTWCDGAATPWTFEAVDGQTNTYTIKNGESYLVANEALNDLVCGALTNDNKSWWKLVSLNDFKVAMQAKDYSATAPMDVSVFIQGRSFNRNDGRNSSWTKTNNGGNWVWIGNCGPSLETSGNYNPKYFGNEAWNNTFSVSQTIENLPDGTYEVQCSGFGTNGTTYIFGNNTSKPIQTDNATTYGSSKEAKWKAIHEDNAFAGQTTGTFTLSGGTLNLGIKRETNKSGDWAIWDEFRLYYYGLDISEFAATLAAAVEAAEAVNGTVPTAAYNALAAVVTENNKTYTTAADYTAAANAIVAATNTAKAMQVNFTRYNNIKTAALAIATNLDTATPDANLAAATTNDAIVAAIAALRAAFLTELQNLTVPTDPGYIDVTAVMVDNASVSTNTEYWTIEGTPNGNNSWGACNYGECEFYKNNFKFYQTLALTPGTWEFGVTGFHRAGNHKTNFYAGSDDKILIPGVESSVVNTMAEAKTYFDAGNGKVALKFLVETAQNIEIGIDNQDTETDMWTIFRDFTLKYYGEPDYSVYETEWNNAVTAAQTALTTYAEFNDFVADEKTTLNTAKENAPTAAGLKAGYIAKINALTSATEAYIAASKKFESAKTAIAKANAIKEAHNFASEAATATFAEAIKAISDKYDDYTLTQEEAVAAGTDLGTAVSSWQANNNSAAAVYLRDGFALGDFGTDPSLQVNTWSEEGDNDGSGFSVPFYQVWTSDANSLPESIYSGTITNLPNGQYKISAWIRVRAKNETAATDATGITMTVNNGDATDVTEGTQIGEGQFQIATYEALGLVKDGKLTLNFNVANDANISWLCFKNVKYTKVRDLTEEEAAVAPTAIALYNGETEVTEPIALNATNNSVTLTVAYTPNNATEGVTWESSDETVATVANGVVTGVAPGIATITATSTLDANVNATATVTVTYPESTVPVSFYANEGATRKVTTIIGENLIKNGSFEYPNAYYGWTYGTGSTTAITSEKFDIVTEDAADGNQYLKAKTNEGGAAAGSLNTSWPIEPNKTYVFGYKVKSTAASTGNQYLGASLNTTKGQENTNTKLANPAYNANEWTVVQYVFESGDNTWLVFNARWLAQNISFDNFYLAEAKYTLGGNVDYATAAIPTANIGEGAFQYSQNAIDAVNALAQGTASVEEVQAAYDAVTTINAPADGQLFNVILTYEGYDYDNKAVTYLAGDRTDMGNYNIKYNAPANKNLAQAFTFTKVSGNNYKMSQIDAEGNIRYVCTGVPYNGNTSQIRTTTNVDDALVVTIIPTETEGVYNLKNTEADNFIGSQDAGFYTVNSHIDFKIVETTKPSIAINTTEAGWGTVMLPFAVATLPENVKAYTCAELKENGTTLNLVEVNALEANKPYIIEGAWDETVSGDAQGTALIYKEGLLTGIYEATQVPVGSYILQNQDNVVAFYNVVDGQQPTLKANHAYLTVDGNSAREALYFGGDATGIMAIDALTSGNATIFNAAGAQIPALQKGMNIVRKADGKSYKVIVK